MSTRSQIRKGEKETTESKKSRKRQPKNETEVKSVYVEASSDDEFAKEFFILPSKSSDDEGGKSSRRRNRKKKRKVIEKEQSDIEKTEHQTEDDNGSKEHEIEVVVDSEDESEEENNDELEYKIQHILASQSLTPTDWRTICDAMDTREMNRGSVLKQPDSGAIF